MFTDLEDTLVHIEGMRGEIRIDARIGLGLGEIFPIWVPGNTLSIAMPVLGCQTAYGCE